MPLTPLPPTHACGPSPGAAPHVALPRPSQPRRHALRGFARAIVWSALAVAATMTATADADDRADHEQARRAVAAGEVMPLRAVLDKLERELPGQVMEVELEREGEQWQYEIKLLRPNGSLVRLRVDARDARVLGVREHRRGEHDRRGH